MRFLTFKGGDEMPALGLGTWKSAPGEVGAAIKEAIKIGYRHIDCASVYGNEAEIGAALADVFAEGNITRDDLWITSKLWCNRHGREDVVPAIQASIDDLGVEYLDLYLVHWPVAIRSGAEPPTEPGDLVSLEELPLEETWAGMEEALELGLARHIGVSNYSAKKLGQHLSMEHPPELDQVEMHPYLAQPDLLKYGQEHGIHLTAYSPLGSGDRPDSMKGKDEKALLDDPVVNAVAARLSITPAQVLLAWALGRGTSVIPKSVNPNRLAENFAAAEIELDAQAMSDLAALDDHRRYVTGNFWAKPGSPYTVAGLWDE
ncbi:putative oxidoreductase [Planctomycetes bacterium Poly30]|uniref:Putative oxidoreductase n=1 Tax=Saltatorellus ferox TaxID=2528018 RepID=A0A518EYA7_9BACT|nr:putative oxidoreductase [Planctomycetes bacterium Poly30]